MLGIIYPLVGIGFMYLSKVSGDISPLSPNVPPDLETTSMDFKSYLRYSKRMLLKSFSESVVS